MFVGPNQKTNSHKHYHHKNDSNYNVNDQILFKVPQISKETTPPYLSVTL